MMEQRIRDVLADFGRLGVDVQSLDPNADLYEAGLTSHASVNVMLGLEEAFDIEFPTALLRKSTFASIGAIDRAVRTLPASLVG
jgi:acyl carrier protein